MSISIRRNSLRKSSISINSIRNTFTSFSKGITNAKQKSDDILKQTRDTNLFKSKLIRKDGEFFAKRRENVRRKNREDELESSSISGVAKKEGNIVTRSTRGFLGRIIDFLGVVLVGWALINLPIIIKRLQGLFKLIQRVVDILSGFIGAIRDFLVAIGKPIVSLIDALRKIDFTRQRKQIQESTESANSSLTKLDKDFRESVNDFINDENISQAGAYADQIEKNNRRETQNEKVEAVLAPQPGDREANERQQVDTQQENITVETQTPDIEPRAEGGPVEPNKPYKVGERGVELFVPDQSGTIIPNDELVAQNTEVEEEDDESELEGVKGIFGDTEKLLSNENLGDASPTPISGTSPLPIDTSNLTPDKSEKNKADLITTPKSKDMNMSVVPVKRKEFKMMGRKKKKSVIMIVEKPVGQGQPVVTGGGQKSPMTTVVNKSSDKMLLELQSVSSLKYT